MDPAKRYLSLDVFRGLTIASMILVNNPGSWSWVYAPLRHSEWNGCTPTDLVFPFFLFIVGISMFFSLKKFETKSRKEALLKVGKRVLIIFLIGLFLNSFPQWSYDYSKLRIMGVLQRIALAYGLGAVSVLFVPRKFLIPTAALILLLYWGILYYFGGTGPYTLPGNATIPFDSFLFGTSHLYKGFGIAFDPEGVLSTIPAIATVILGYLAGNLILASEKKTLPLKLIFIGIVGIVLGWSWGIFLPVNKPLWTGSYVLYTAGWACVVLGFLVWLIDVKSYTRWTGFFVVFGMNPLFIFALSGLWARTLTRIIKITEADGSLVNGNTWLYNHVFQPVAGNMNGSLLYALTHIAVFWAIGYFLYKKKIFIKV